MTAANEELVSRNLELTAMKEHHANLRHRLGTPALLLFGLTFLFSIPLILTISGVIPFSLRLRCFIFWSQHLQPSCCYQLLVLA